MSQVLLLPVFGSSGAAAVVVVTEAVVVVDSGALVVVVSCAVVLVVSSWVVLVVSLWVVLVVGFSVVDVVVGFSVVDVVGWSPPVVPAPAGKAPTRITAPTTIEARPIAVRRA
jgi:hypothetical protein